MKGKKIKRSEYRVNDSREISSLNSLANVLISSMLRVPFVRISLIQFKNKVAFGCCFVRRFSSRDVTKKFAISSLERNHFLKSFSCEAKKELIQYQRITFRERERESVLNSSDAVLFVLGSHKLKATYWGI